ncbi:Hypothetical protein A7982_07819 [Minicystis rosea]|nr:Hypothetical protein A7982_07819 [Minicystis rosea]
MIRTDSTEIFRRVFQLLDQMEEVQKQKVIDLARRLKPGLTAEDIRNPHDFPDLDDPDWHFEDGQLTGIQAVRFAMTGLERELDSNGEAGESDESGEGQQGEGTEA